MKTFKSILILFPSVFLFLFFALILAVSKSYSYLSGLLFLWVLFTLIGEHKTTFLQQDSRQLIACLCILPLSLLLLLLLVGGKWGGVDYQMRALLLLPIMLAFDEKKLDIRIYHSGVVLGCILAGVLAFWQVKAGALRAGNYITNEIPYGQIAAILAFLAFLIVWHRQNIYLRVIAMVATVFGLAAMVFSGTRGAILGFLAALIFASCLKLKWSVKVIVSVVLGMTLLSFTLSSVPEVKSRLVELSADYDAYQTGNSFTSVGVRLELWKMSMAIAHEHPLAGVGPGNFPAELKKQAALGHAPAFVANFNHAHSEYFNTLANAGFIGFFALLISLVGPLFLFIRRFYRTQGVAKHAGLMGASLIVMTMVFDLTQPLYAHNISTIFYLITLATCWHFSGRQYDMPVEGEVDAK